MLVVRIRHGVDSAGVMLVVRIRHGVDSATINLWDDVRKTMKIAIVSQLN